MVHRLPRLLELFGRECAQISRRDGVFGHDVRLAERRPSQLDGIELHGGAAEDDAGIESEVRLSRHLLADGIDDARQLEHGAVSDVFAENL